MVRGLASKDVSRSLPDWLSSKRVRLFWEGPLASTPLPGMCLARGLEP